MELILQLNWLSAVASTRQTVRFRPITARTLPSDVHTHWITIVCKLKCDADRANTEARLGLYPTQFTSLGHACGAAQ